MAPYSPASPLKRPSPPESPEGVIDEPIPKKRRKDSYIPQTPPAELVESEVDGENIKIGPEALPSQNEQMDITLKRSITLALNHVGFESASKEALESFTQLTNTYISKLLSTVMASTAVCRRTMPVPQDYIYSFHRMQINPLSLVPHTKLPRGLPEVRPQYLPQDPIEAPYVDHIGLLNPKLTGAEDKESKMYIPTKFPTFPALHTYKYTEYYPFVREKDHSKIREKAAEDRRHVEGILHRQLDQRKHEGRLKNSGTNRSARAKKMDELWEKAMGVTLSGEEPTGELKVAVVNSARKYGYLRKPPPITKKSTDSKNQGGSIVVKT